MAVAVLGRGLLSAGRRDGGVSDRPASTAAPAVALRAGVPTPVNPWRHGVSSLNSMCLLLCNGERGSWGFYGEEKASLVSVSFTGSDAAPT